MKILTTGENGQTTSSRISGHVTERRKDGRTCWLSGFRGDHPNNHIAEMIARVAAPSFNRWLPDFIRTISDGS